MRRILIQQDDKLLEDICSDLSHFKKSLIPVIEAYKQLELGDFTNDIFKDVQAGNSNDITAKYKDALNDHLINTLVKNAILKRIVLEGTEESIANFLNACRNFVNTDTTPDRHGRHKERRVFLTAEDLSFKAGELFISNETKEQLLERHCRLYVESENDHLIYKSLLKMQSALQEFRSVLFDLNLPMELLDMLSGKGYLVHRHIEDFFTCGPDKIVKIKPEAIKWAANYDENYKRMVASYNNK